MRLRLYLLGLSALLLGATNPELPPVHDDQIRNYVRTGGPLDYRNEQIVGWEKALRETLKSKSPDAAADDLATTYRLPRAEMRKLVRLWLTVNTHAFAFEHDKSMRAEARRQLLALLVSSGRAPLVLAVTAGVLDAFSDCSAADFDAMMAGSSDRAGDAWQIATAVHCEGNFLRFLSMAPLRPTPGLVRLADWGLMQPVDAMPLYAWLISGPGLARVDAADRPAYQTAILQRYLRVLFDAGFTDRAVDVIERLPPDMRARIFSPSREAFTATVDGLPLTFDREYLGPGLQLDLAAAYALAGRSTEAQSLLAAIPRSPGNWRDSDAALIDHFLHRMGEDPYLLAETHFSGATQTPSAPLAAVRCRVFPEPQYDICSPGAADPQPYQRYGSRETKLAASRRHRASLDRLDLPGLRELRAQFTTMLKPAMARYEAMPDSVSPPTKAPDRLTPAPFAELPLPERYRGRRPESPAWPAGWTKLRDDMLPIRVEQDGTRVVVIARALGYGGNGRQYAPGGYWLHLSDDGGRTWRAYFTGLVAHAPYVIFAASNLPLIDGDTLNIEVEVAEPEVRQRYDDLVIIRPARRIPHLYLRMPLAGVVRDSNGDGMSDVTEQAFLLDRSESRGTPYVVPHVPPAECASRSADQIALEAIVGALFGTRDPRTDGTYGSGRFTGLQDLERPILIIGDARKYRCLGPDRLMLIYGRDEAERLQRIDAGFGLTHLSTPIYNRARDRGYFRHDEDVYRLRLVDGSWKVEPISITTY